mmetsp:Transcript_5509/g.9847  ORF Transcript_5509/g.9847 Transcript_5509/m.9847 type:complete len:252 (-) Transcript_5509:1925-2680(-)
MALVTLPRNHFDNTLQRYKTNIVRMQRLSELGDQVRCLEGAPLRIARVVGPANAGMTELHKRSICSCCKFRYDGHGNLLDSIPIHPKIKILPSPLLLLSPQRIHKTRSITRRKTQPRHVPNRNLQILLRIPRHDIHGILRIGTQPPQRQRRRMRGFEPRRTQYLAFEVFSRGFLHDERAVEVDDDDARRLGSGIRVLQRGKVETLESQFGLAREDRVGGTVPHGIHFGGALEGGIVQVPKDVSRPQPGGTR